MSLGTCVLCQFGARPRPVIMAETAASLGDLPCHMRRCLLATTSPVHRSESRNFHRDPHVRSTRLSEGCYWTPERGQDKCVCGQRGKQEHERSEQEDRHHHRLGTRVLQSKHSRGNICFRNRLAGLALELLSLRRERICSLPHPCTKAADPISPTRICNQRPTAPFQLS